MSSGGREVVSGTSPSERPEFRIKTLDNKNQDSYTFEKLSYLSNLSTFYVAQVEKIGQDNTELDDVKEHIFEAVLEMFYGDKIWPYLNSQENTDG